MKHSQFFGKTAVWYLATLHKAVKSGWPIGHFESYGDNLDQEDLDAGTLIFEYAYGKDFSKDVTFNEGNASILSNIFKSYIKTLQEALFDGPTAPPYDPYENLPLNVHDGVLGNPSKPKEYVGTKGSVYEGLVSITDIKEISGYYGLADLVSFTDKDGNVIKVFAKSGVGKSLKVNEKAMLYGTVSKHHVYGGEKETILKHASIEQGPNVNLKQFSNEVEASPTHTPPNVPESPPTTIEVI